MSDNLKHRLSKGKAYFYKLIFDGLDLMQTPLGEAMVNPRAAAWNTEFGIATDRPFNSYSFLEWFSARKADFQVLPAQAWLSHALAEKYEVGYYQLGVGKGWKGSPYILFNEKELGEWAEALSFDLTKLAFYVMLSKNEMGLINNVAFRIVDQDMVDGAFKWLFACGQHATFGMDHVDQMEECRIVEGFRDYIALTECKINAIALGSVNVSPKQRSAIDQLYRPIFLFDNDQFGLEKALKMKAEGEEVEMLICSGGTKDPYDAWMQLGRLAMVKVK